MRYLLIILVTWFEIIVSQRLGSSSAPEHFKNNRTTFTKFPSEVQDMKTMVNSSRTYISWTGPEIKRGDIIKYDVVYLGSRESSCPSTFEPINVLSKQTYIEGLKFYSKYQIMMNVITNGVEEKGYTEYIETHQLDDISDDERLAIETYEVSSDSVVISLTKIDCNDVKGPIHVQCIASCIHQWCTDIYMSKVFKYSLDPSFITVTGLFPYSNYTTDLAMSRDGHSWINIGRVEFQTKPSVPNSVSHLEVISKDCTSISLRWMEPYPPTGVLKQYVIQYSYRSIFETVNKSVIVSPQSCPLWKNYHCGTLTKWKLYHGYRYSIQVNGQNEDPPNIGAPSEKIFVNIIDEPPQPTYGISLLWDEKNDLSITWYHPNVTNGLLTSFEITLENTEDGIPLPIKNYFVHFSEPTYSLTYTKTVPSAQLQACTEYRASIIVHNIHAPSPLSYSSATSPPDVPPSIQLGNLEFESSDSTITLHIPSVGSGTTIYQEKLYILVSKADETEDLVLFENNLKRMDGLPILKTSWIVYDSIRTNSCLQVTIGGNDQTGFKHPPLEPGTNYSVSIILSNSCFGMVRLNRTQIYISTLE